MCCSFESDDFFFLWFVVANSSQKELFVKTFELVWALALGPRPLGRGATSSRVPLCARRGHFWCLRTPLCDDTMPKRARGAEAPSRYVMSPEFMAGNCLSALQVPPAVRVACLTPHLPISRGRGFDLRCVRGRQWDMQADIPRRAITAGCGCGLSLRTLGASAGC